MTSKYSTNVVEGRMRLRKENDQLKKELELYKTHFGPLPDLHQRSGSAVSTPAHHLASSSATTTPKIPSESTETPTRKHGRPSEQRVVGGQPSAKKQCTTKDSPDLAEFDAAAATQRKAFQIVRTLLRSAEKHSKDVDSQHQALQKSLQKIQQDYESLQKTCQGNQKWMAEAKERIRAETKRSQDYFDHYQNLKSKLQESEDEMKKNIETLQTERAGLVQELKTTEKQRKKESEELCSLKDKMRMAVSLLGETCGKHQEDGKVAGGAKKGLRFNGGDH
ncbi:hypothetical protein NpPPO83_00009745 [Neofusicoccum parvum]|uniref:Uncharacterized protein n=1 Tax=Neofusicoccum parvum TaxID=310453 RepID=A0ACB5S592_9PEZI|nr:hypothetical protein NpPPO83_00009745 [Neofusicoccum parvum]